MFSSWLKKSRRALGLTQKRLGQLAGVSGSTIGMWEQGKRVPNAKNAARLRAFFATQRLKMPLPPRRPEPSERERFMREIKGALERRQR